MVFPNTMMVCERLDGDMALHAQDGSVRSDYVEVFLFEIPVHIYIYNLVLRGKHFSSQRLE
jgi:hypothetical protein